MSDSLIRPYRPADRAAVADICIRTGDGGVDATPVYPDPQILPAIFALPYVELEPDLAFVVDHEGTVAGYVLGAADTATFARRFAAEWLPTVADRYPLPVGPPSTPAERMALLLHHPERMVRPELADYPAHLHIDLLPGHQGAGYGRKLITALFAALHAKGVARVHLEMATSNTGARAFYDRVGFHELWRSPAPGTTVLGRSTAPTP
ncbi:GNAT family N-acetyltransferase [Pseudonocardia sp. GCM10023141]|uniref:GNAT family N-acetyltransferase n=1 Tax=Pseudonocardia sp. GCM10023141 TaxID=3252653 RepID=UPI00361A85AD